MNGSGTVCIEMVSSPRRWFIAAVVVWAAAVSHGQTWASETGPIRIDFPNGIKATVYTSEYLLAHTQMDGSRGRIDIEDGLSLNVVTAIGDPLIVNKGDGRFHAFSTDQVLRQLREIEYPRLRVGVEVFVLPFPRSQLLVSSTSGRRVFLSPHVYPVGDETAAYIVAHEMGHVFQDAYLPLDAIYDWDEYRRLRGIANAAIYNASAAHADRPLEIFAEDFRVLYGGQSAFFDGRVENTLLPSPAMVAGLEGFFARLSADQVAREPIIHVNAYPNPFNPRTELLVQLDPAFFDAGDRLSIRIYDVTGALVRELYADHPRDLEVRVGWDGKDQRGRQVASSTYFASIEAGQTHVSKKLLMIK